MEFAKDHSPVNVGLYFTFQPTLCEAITYNLDQRFEILANYTHLTVQRQKFTSLIWLVSNTLKKFLVLTEKTRCGNSTRIIIQLLLTSSPTLDPFGDSDFLLLEEADSFLGLADDPDCPAYNPFYYDPEGDILILEAILNSEPPLPPPSQGTYLPEVRTELKLDVEEKNAAQSRKGAKSHKRAPRMKLSDIQGIQPGLYPQYSHGRRLCPVVQHQKKIKSKNPRFIKKEVEKLSRSWIDLPFSPTVPGLARYIGVPIRDE
ncbi:hypothetical protein Tco_0857630 [Tanacetum coccineum]|uniref:Reverse transcriptase domain-containing protein n=1 Tax=Tanacetum coccineum TaxID=301880 RepID=A0ABQ5B9V2_9ASTR